MNQDRKAQSLLDGITKEELEKIEAHKAKTKGAYPVDDYWLLLAEWLRIAGWQGYMAVKNDEIDMAEMMTLIESNRKLESLDMYRNSLTSFIGASSSQTKRPSSIFKKLTNQFITKAKADE